MTTNGTNGIENRRMIQINGKLEDDGRRTIVVTVGEFWLEETETIEDNGTKRLEWFVHWNKQRSNMRITLAEYERIMQVLRRLNILAW